MMGKRDKTASPRIDAAVAQATNFEVTVADLARRSERRAWWVAGASVTLAVMMGAGYVAVLPLKEKVPYLVMADAYTGTATVATLKGDFLKNEITKQEAVNRSNIAHFVLARESYDAALMFQRDWRTVYTMASPQVASVYTELNSRQNPDSPIRVYGKDQAIRVRILSIVLSPREKGRKSSFATVRFQRSLYDKGRGVQQPLDSKIATLEFTYKDNLAMDEKYRIENPLGFQVLTYRVDNDYAAAPPLEPEMVPQAALAALKALQQSAAPAPVAVPGTAAPAAAGAVPAASPASPVASPAPPVATPAGVSTP